MSKVLNRTLHDKQKQKRTQTEQFAPSSEQHCLLGRSFFIKAGPIRTAFIEHSSNSIFMVTTAQKSAYFTKAHYGIMIKPEVRESISNTAFKQPFSIQEELP